MIFLPRNLAALARLTADGAARYAFHGVHLFEYAGSYRAEATDGRRLGIVRGPDVVREGLGERQRQVLEDAPNGVFEAIIPGESWEKVFGQLPKKVGGAEAVLGIAMGERSTTFAGPEFTGTADHVDGRFPDCDAVLPKGPATFAATVNPKLLAELLTVAAHYSDARVTLLFFGEGKPIGVVARNESGQTFDGLVMPIVDEPRPKAAPCDPEPQPTASEEKPHHLNGRGKALKRKP